MNPVRASPTRIIASRPGATALNPVTTGRTTSTAGSASNRRACQCRGRLKPVGPHHRRQVSNTATPTGSTMLTARARAVPDHDGASACSTSAPATVTTAHATARSTATEPGRSPVRAGDLMLLAPTRGRPDLLTEAEPAEGIRFTIAPLLAANLGIGGGRGGGGAEGRRGPVWH